MTKIGGRGFYLRDEQDFSWTAPLFVSRMA